MKGTEMEQLRQTIENVGRVQQSEKVWCEWVDDDGVVQRTVEDYERCVNDLHGKPLGPASGSQDQSK